ncbi:hypothetical protein WG68_18370 [Arsukibacterium ikkense]|uniref:Uncharacterized protein n=1 Tax=Arsukibacterium ikkense TaxID=336831 RepID=A0A0M2V0J8_9GAMM|nr:hypothetical protein [Arsukibacterium ikkense]KKO43904.1 hypothetical protein WG68_18370 [Arsukibacterium ikkense]
MSAITHTLHQFFAEYGRAVLLAVLVHAIILALLLTTKFSQPASPQVAEPIISFLYQPPPVVPPPTPAATAAWPSEAEIAEQLSTELPPSLATASKPSVNVQSTAAGGAVVTEQENEIDAIADPQARLVGGESLAQRVLNQVAEPDQAAIEQAANTSYQQFLQKQQQPRLTVDKKHWPVSQNPAQQVVAQLNDGKHIVRIRKGVCVIGDPTLDGFEELMAARRVPCGNEVATSELLKQALDKHIKR